MEKVDVNEVLVMVTKVDGQRGIWFLGEVVNLMVKQLLWKVLK